MLYSPLEQFTVAVVGFGIPNFLISLAALVGMLLVGHYPALHPSLVPGR